MAGEATVIEGGEIGARQRKTIKETPRTAEQQVSDSLTAEEESALETDEITPPDSEPADPALASEPKRNLTRGDLQKALKEEREGRKGDREKAAELERKLAAADETQRAKERLLDDRLAKMEAAAQQRAQQASPVAPPAEPEVPDIQTDPVGHFRALAQRETKARAALEQRLNEVSQKTDSFNQTIQAEAQRRTVMDWAAASQSEFSSKQPDYGEAMSFLRSRIGDEMDATGQTAAWAAQLRTSPEVARAQGVQNILNQIIQVGFQNQRNPAEMAYTLAKTRGYAPSQPNQQQQSQQAPGQVTDLATVRRGQEHARSLNSAGGTIPRRTSLESLAEMTQSDFDKTIKDASAFKKLFGA